MEVFSAPRSSPPDRPFPIPNPLSSDGRTLTSSRNPSLFFLNAPSLRPLSGARKLRASARLESRWRRREDSNRRNSLREKFVRREIPIPIPIPIPPQVRDATPEQVQESSDVPSVGSVGSECSDVPKESVMRSKLEDWVDRYKRDNEVWGVGTGSIFTVYQDSDGNVGRVLVSDDEIARRSKLEGKLDVDWKMKRAMDVAKEVECGRFKFPDNSSIVKYVVEEKSVANVDRFKVAVSRCRNLTKFYPQIAVAMLSGCFVYWMVKNSWSGGGRRELTGEEKEMLRRKLKSRKELNKVVVGNVEVVEDTKEVLGGFDKRPELNRNELMENITKAKASNDASLMLESSSSGSFVHDVSFEDKVREIRGMAREAREAERLELPNDRSRRQSDAHLNENNLLLNVNQLNVESRTDIIQDDQDLRHGETITPLEIVDEAAKKIQSPSLDSPSLSSNSFPARKPKIITSVKEAREYLSQKHKIPNGKMLLQEDSSNHDILNRNKVHSSSVVNEFVKNPTVAGDKEDVCFPTDIVEKPLPLHVEEVDNKRESTSNMHGKDIEDSSLSQLENVNDINKKENKKMNEETDTAEIDTQFGADTGLMVNSTESSAKEKEHGRIGPQIFPNADEISEETKVHSSYGPQHGNYIGGPMRNTNSNQGSDASSYKTELGSAQANTNWMEDNFEKFDPIVKKIGSGFRENYMTAKGKNENQKLVNMELSELGLMDDDEELEWMNDEKLRDIVFQVRDNELAGYSPFHMMSSHDEDTYFEGLAKKAEKVNMKLQGLHEFIHSRVENIDYGADGISLNDPLEKIIPRWKGATIERVPDFLNHHNKNKKTSVEGSKNCSTVDDMDSISQKDEEKLFTNEVSSYSAQNIRKQSNEESSKQRTVIECSDGSNKVGKKGGKEHWQHTKKWSREFLELYNAETDPEIKSVMKDMGKELDRWITEKEIQDVGDLMTSIPKRKRQFLEKKLNKLKREIELFGTEAVVCKYKEYSDEKEEDYLWWLDLKFVLCIELYGVEDDAQKVGFYSLEMAEDLELNPKQYHIIAFEDPGDAKNFCYVMQAHLEMLGKGRAFVVPRLPKDAFREAKATGFHVTVVREGELKLDIDKTLEEVEEDIIEIGTKMYHDKIMHERGVDMGALVKGVLASDKSNKKRSSKRISKKVAAR